MERFKCNGKKYVSQILKFISYIELLCVPKFIILIHTSWQTVNISHQNITIKPNKRLKFIWNPKNICISSSRSIDRLIAEASLCWRLPNDAPHALKLASLTHDVKDTVRKTRLKIPKLVEWKTSCKIISTAKKVAVTYARALTNLTSVGDICLNKKSAKITRHWRQNFIS